MFVFLINIMERKVKRTKKRSLLTDDYLMSLPEEIRQKILIKLDPFEIHRLCKAARRPALKNYCNTEIWPTLLRLKYPEYYENEEMQQSFPNPLWAYFSCFIAHGIPDGEYVLFVPPDFIIPENTHFTAYPCIFFGGYIEEQFYMGFNFESKHEPSKAGTFILNFFQYTMATSTINFDSNEDGNGPDDTFVGIVFNTDEETETFIRIVYKLFEKGFSLVDELPDWTKDLIRSCISCNVKQSQFACMQCFNAQYCSEECQANHWPTHLKECKLSQ